MGVGFEVRVIDALLDNEVCQRSKLRQLWITKIGEMRLMADGFSSWSEHSELLQDGRTTTKLHVGKSIFRESLESKAFLYATLS